MGPASRLTLALLALLTSPVALAAPSPGPRCDSSTALTLLGIDTEGGSVLLSFGNGEERWLVDFRLPERSAEVHRDITAGRRVGGSVGPGPILAASPCGPRCLQVLRWNGDWEPLGKPIAASERLFFEGTWDEGGSPWVALQSWGGEAGITAIAAYRLEGQDWVDKGGLAVQAAGSPAVHPAPGMPSSVVAGTGRFHADRKPEHWLSSLPDAQGTSLGQVVPVGEREAVMVTPGAHLRLTADGGGRWRELRRQPWSPGEGDLAWRPGHHYWVELPTGSLGPPTGLVWVDNRVAHRRHLYLASLAPPEGLRVLFEGREGILTEGGDRLPFNHVVRFTDERWLLLTGCVGREEGGALVFRELHQGRIGPPEVLPLALAVPGAPP